MKEALLKLENRLINDLEGDSFWLFLSAIKAGLAFVKCSDKGYVVGIK